MDSTVYVSCYLNSPDYAIRIHWHNLKRLKMPFPKVIHPCFPPVSSALDSEGKSCCVYIELSWKDLILNQQSQHEYESRSLLPEGCRWIDINLNVPFSIDHSNGIILYAGKLLLYYVSKESFHSQSCFTQLKYLS